MSQENVELARASIDSIQRGDVEAALSFFSEEAEDQGARTTKPPRSQGLRNAPERSRTSTAR